MKNKDAQKFLLIALAFVVVVGGGMYFILDGGKASTIETIPQDAIVDEAGNLVGPWASKLVQVNLLTSDKFTGADVVATAKVYESQPDDWNNARGEFSEAVEYTLYTSASGVAEIDREMPGSYYVVLEASGYNTEFLMLSIPDGTGRGDISDYSTSPDSQIAEMTQRGATTDEDFAITLTNATTKTVKETILLTIDENTEFKGWKVIVNDEEGFSTDTDGDGTYDEGIKSMKVSVGGVEYTVFDPVRGVDEFDSNDEYTFKIENVKLADEDDLIIKVEIVANTGDYVGANDEVWGEGEGVLSYIKVYDAEADIFATVDVTA